MREVACGLLGCLIGTIIYLVFTAIRDYRKESFEAKVRHQVKKVLDEYGIKPTPPKTGSHVKSLITHYVEDF